MICDFIHGAKHGHYVSKATGAVYFLLGFKVCPDGEVMPEIETEYGETIWLDLTWFRMNFTFVDSPYPPLPVN